MAAAVAATFLTAARPSVPTAGLPPPGANDPACRGPVVVLLHGTRADMTVNWPYVSSALRDDGFCPWALDRDVTRARRVSILGHSLGGLVGRHHVRFGGGHRRVDDLIAMGTPQRGYWSPPPYDQADAVFNTGCAACWEMQAGSHYLGRLDRGDPTPPPVSYTQIITMDDGIATPVDNQFLPEDPGVSNIVLQRACPDHHVDHFQLAADEVTYQWVRHALSVRGPARPDHPVVC